MKKGFKTVPLLLLFLPVGCVSKPTVIDPPNRVYSSQEIGVSLSLPPEWHLSSSENTLFIAHYQPTGTPLVRLIATVEKEIPRFEDYLQLSRFLTLPQKMQKVSPGELSHFQHLSSRKLEWKGKVWEESVWSGMHRGEAKIFHTYTILVQLNLVQLHFEFPVPFYNAQSQIILPVLDRIVLHPRPPSSKDVVRAHRAVAETYKRLGLWKEASDAFLNALAKAPQDADLHVLLAESYFQGQEMDLALQEFMTAIRLDSQNSRAYQGLADVYFKKGFIDQGITLIKRAVALSPNRADLYIKLGDAYLEQGRTQESIQTYQKLIRRHPEAAEGHLGLGKAYLSIELHEQAILELEQALRIHPQLVEPHCLLEKAYRQLESTTEAEREKRLCRRGGSASS